jgi:hypothetical protein
MTAVRLISRADAIAKLRSYGCKPVAGKGRLNTADWWQWPWAGVPFTLPFEADVVDQWALQKLLADMAERLRDGGFLKTPKYDVDQPVI